MKKFTLLFCSIVLCILLTMSCKKETTIVKTQAQINAEKIKADLGSTVISSISLHGGSFGNATYTVTNFLTSIDTDNGFLTVNNTQFSLENLSSFIIYKESNTILLYFL